MGIAGRRTGFGLAHANTCPLADRGGDGRNMTVRGSRQSSIERPDTRCAPPMTTAARPHDPPFRAVRPRGRRRAPGRSPSPASARRAAAGPCVRGPGAAGREIRVALGAEGATAWLAERDGAPSATSSASQGRPRGARTSGSRPPDAAVEPEVIRELYAVAADAWVDGRTEPLRPRPGDGRRPRRRLVPARLRAAAPARGPRAAGQGVRRSCRAPSWSSGARERDDIPALAELELVLPRHSQASPVFAAPPIQSVEEVAGGARGGLGRSEMHDLRGRARGPGHRSSLAGAPRDVVGARA